MAHQLSNAPRAPCNDETPTPLTLEQVLGVLFDVVPHMPRESQMSFLAMFRRSTSSPSSHEPSTTPTLPRRPLLTPDILRSVIQAKTVQHLCESDSAFEAKQRAAENTLRKSGGSKGVTKRYGKPQKNQVVEKRALRAAVPPVNAHTTPYGVPWSGGGATVSGSLQPFGTAAGPTHFFHWHPNDPPSSVRGYSHKGTLPPLCTSIQFST